MAQEDRGPEHFREALRNAGVAARELGEAAQYASIHGIDAAMELWVHIPQELQRRAAEITDERFGGVE